MSRDPISPPTLAADDSGAPRRRDARLLADPPRARRSGAGHARRERVAAGRRASCDAGSASIDRCIVQYVHVPARRGRGDLGTSLRTNQPVTGADRRAHAGDVRAGGRGDDRRARRSPFRSASSRRCARGTRDRSRGDDARAGRHFDAEFLARPAAGHRVFGEAGMAAGLRSRHARRNLVLPAITLGAPLAAILARMTRASVLEELRELYVLAARARGVSRTRRRPPARVSQQPHSDRHGARAAVRLGADRRGDHRDDLCVARRRTPADSVDQRSRLSRSCRVASC